MNENFIAELIGTAVLILLGNGVVANVVLNKTKGNSSGWIVITTGWAFAVLVAISISGRISGAHLNPAVTLANVVNGSMSISTGIMYFFAQLIGAVIGAMLVWVFYKDHFDATEDQGAVLACFSTGPAIRNYGSNFLCEVIATCTFLLAIFGISHPQSGFGNLGALFVSIGVWSIGLSLGGTTGYAINPIRDFGPRIAHTILPIKGKGTSDWSYAWVPFFGPLVGAVLAVYIFKLLI